MTSSYFLPSNMVNSHRLGYPGGGRRNSSSSIVLGQAGRCPHEATLVTMLFDNSGSVSTGNDPIGNRYGETRLAVEAIAKRCRCHQELAAVVHFDTPTSRCVSPTTLDRHGVETVLSGLSIPTDGRGISMLGPSLKRAYEMAGEWPDHQHVLVVASDFELFDHDVDRVLADLRSFPGIVHAVVLRSEPPAVLLDDENVVVTRVAYQDQSGTVARAIFKSLTAYRRQ